MASKKCDNPACGGAWERVCAMCGDKSCPKDFIKFHQTKFTCAGCMKEFCKAQAQVDSGKTVTVIKQVRVASSGDGRERCMNCHLSRAFKNL